MNLHDFFSSYQLAGDDTKRARMRQLLTRRRFPIGQARLVVFLNAKYPGMLNLNCQHYSLYETWQALDKYICDEALYEARNPTVIRANKALEEILNVPYWHREQTLELLRNQFHASASELERDWDLLKNPHPMNLNVWNEPMLNGYETSRVNRDFIDLIRAVDPTVSIAATKFHNSNLLLYVHQFYYQNKEHYSDPRNEIMVNAKNTLLGRVFNVDLFHWHQVEALIQSVISPLAAVPRIQALEASTPRHRYTNYILPKVKSLLRQPPPHQIGIFQDQGVFQLQHIDQCSHQFWSLRI